MIARELAGQCPAPSADMDVNQPMADTQRKPVKITGIEVFPVWGGFRNYLFVVVDTDEGIWGVGEAGITSRELAVIGAIEHFKPLLIRRPWDRAYLAGTLTRRLLPSPAHSDVGHLGDRYCPVGYQRQGPECADLPAAWRARPRPGDLLPAITRAAPTRTISSRLDRLMFADQSRRLEVCPLGLAPGG